MFGGGDQHALAHEACRVADLRDISASSGNLKVVEVSAPKDDSGAGWCREESHRNWCARMEPDPGEFQGRCYCLLQVRWMCQSNNSESNEC